MSTDNYEIIATLDDVILRDTKSLGDHDVNSPEYEKNLKAVERLHKIRHDALPDPTTVEDAKQAAKKDRVRFKDFIPMISSIGGIALIVVFEAFGHTMTSKATAFVSKSK